MILVDTNVFLEFLLGRRHAEDCGRLLSKLSRGEMEGVVTRFSLHSIEAVYKSDLLAGFLSNVDRSVGLYVRDTTTAEEAEVAAVAKSTGRDYDDAIQYFVAKRMGAEAIVSFDRHFDGLDISRVEPGKLLQG
ncbi:MAG: PIN domain-containing protein [Thaumarchaeota archaeon]|nr:PIN domain-containing protein [Nitrososphaerota archaeon]